MRLIVDANVILRNVLGRKRSVAQVLAAGIDLTVPEPQVAEAGNVLVRKLALTGTDAHILVEDCVKAIEVVELASLHVAEATARARLGPRGQPDWPVLAAALLLDADIWSDDRDFFGVGIAVWCKDTIDIAVAEAVAT